MAFELLKNLRIRTRQVIMDQFTRRIIGFANHLGEIDGPAACLMFNTMITGKPLPKYLSSDNDPLFNFKRWHANLRILRITEIKSVPYTPRSHPFIERLINSIRREYIDHIFFFNKRDLDKKLDTFKHYYNNNRCHSSIESKIPTNFGKKK